MTALGIGINKMGSKEDLEQAALKDLSIEYPLKFGGMYCSLELKIRHGVFGLWEREFSGYDGPKYCLVKKMTLTDGYEFHLRHPYIDFTHDDTKEDAKTQYQSDMYELNLKFMDTLDE